MNVVSNTSPISYLVLIEQVDVLSDLFGQVWIPDAVRRELRDPQAPSKIQEWMEDRPDWLNVETPPVSRSPSPTSERSLGSLHDGEQAAILLAEERAADLILLDEKAGRRIARQRGLAVTGLIGILDRAAEEGLVDVVVAVKRLKTTNCRIAPDLFRWLLDRHTGS
jgi:predicted nucleic acid-binding protein